MPFTPAGILLAAAMLATLPAVAPAAGLKFQSAPQRTAFLELYTSEGCSSCPPAEAWFSGLQHSPRLWKDFVPVAFHVDYWNSSGWTDPWSDAGFSERQRSYAQQWHADTIYTPEFVLNGREWHNWLTGKNGPSSDGEPVGVLSATSADTNRWQVVFAPQKISDTRYEVHAALLAGGIVSNVQGGENRGRRLNHDFVVVNSLQIGLTPENGVSRGKFILDLARFNTGRTRALAVWITRAGKLEPLQATGGWLVPPENANR